MRGVRTFLILLLIAPLVGAQEPENSKFFVRGYVKDLISANFPAGQEALVDNLMHNRLNFRWEPSPTLSIRAEFRNRLFTGDLVRLIPNYGAQIDVNNDYFDLSWMPVNEDRVVAHLMIDRLSLQYEGEDWNVIVGRQRINWGVNLAWNPNDIFNAYSFFDFDYEERPGSDALRFQKFTGFASGYELAVKMADSWDRITAAALYKSNISGYDLQALLGVMENNLVLGTGWAGSIKGAGFKGEASYFRPMNASQHEELLVSVSVDYSFKNSLYLNGSFLYDSFVGENFGLSQLNLSTSNLDVRSLSPYHWSTFLQVTYPFHPLITGGMAIIYFPGEPGVFTNPSLTWSLLNNLDLDLIGQLYLGAEPEDVLIGYLRVKYSF